MLILQHMARSQTSYVLTEEVATHLGVHAADDEALARAALAIDMPDAEVPAVTSRPKQPTKDLEWKPQGAMPQLHERKRLLVVSTTSPPIIPWSKMQCPTSLAIEAEGGQPCPCLIQKVTTVDRGVLGHHKVEILEVPRLICQAHNRSFNVAQDPETWNVVEQMEAAGEVIIQPKIVVLSNTVVLTMDAYR